MTELKDRFSLADEISPRDLWGEARRRAAAPEAPPRAFEWPPGAGRRVAAAAVALAVFAAAAVFAWDLSHPDRNVGPRPVPAVDLAAHLPEGWSELPAPPEVRTGAASAWTGSQLLVWGGYEYTGYGDESSQDDGFVFDAASRAWTQIPDGPLGSRSFAGSAWTGSEFLIWGGYGSTDSSSNGNSDGAAYDPATRSWSLLPEVPIVGRAPLSVWTGEEFIVWGTAIRAGRYLDGAAYDPTTRSWRVIADAPIELTDATAVWTGDEMIVFGAALDENNRSDTATAIGAAYDPETDAWRELPPSPLSPQAVTAAWLNGEMIAWDYEHSSAAYDPGVDRWRPLTDVPLQFFECSPQSVSTERVLFGEFCSKTVVFSIGDGAWHRDPLPLPDLKGGCCWLHELMAAGDVVVVPSLLYGTRRDPVDRRMYVYNPPSAVRTDPVGEMLEPEPFIPQGSERDGDFIRLPVVFPDGSRATLVYPIPLDLATLGVQPDLSYAFRDSYQGTIVFLHDPNASIAPFVDPDAGSRLVNTSEGGIEIWRSRPDPEYRNASYPVAWLRFPLESWTVLVPLQHPGLAEVVGASLELRETASGFPVVTAHGEAELAEGFGEAGGAQLAFGDGNAHPFSVSQLEEFVELSPDGCDPQREAELSEGYGATCLGDGAVFASIYGDRDFVASVIEGLRVEDLREA